MKPRKIQSTKHLMLFVSLLLMAGLACRTLFGDPEEELSIEETTMEATMDDQTSDSSESAEDELQEEDAAADESGESDQAEDVEGEDGEASGSEEPASPEEETGGEAGAEPLILGEFGFVQLPERTEVAYSFHLENPNEEYGIEDSEYQVAVFDSSGTVLEADSGFVNLVLPGQETAVASSVWLDEGDRAAEIEVQLKSGDPVILDSVPNLSVSSTRFFNEEFSQRATGILESEYDEYMEDIIVTVVAYDGQGNIAGSGYSYVDWIDPGESTGVETYMTASSEVEEIVMYPRLSFYSLEPAYGVMPEGASNFELVDVGHYRDESGITFGLVTKNPNPNYAIEDAKYSATGYAEDGSVLFVDRGYMDLILPGDQMVAGRFIFLDSDEPLDRIDYRLRAGTFIETEPIPLFETENVTFLADEFSPTVTGEVFNPFGWDMEDVRVWAMLYDEQNNIAGSGYSYIDFIPANGSAATEIYVDGHPAPTRIELYPAVGYFDEILEPTG